MLTITISYVTTTPSANVFALMLSAYKQNISCNKIKIQNHVEMTEIAYH